MSKTAPLWLKAIYSIVMCGFSGLTMVSLDALPTMSLLGSMSVWALFPLALLLSVVIAWVTFVLTLIDWKISAGMVLLCSIFLAIGTLASIPTMLLGVGAFSTEGGGYDFGVLFLSLSPFPAGVISLVCCNVYLKK